MSAEARDRASRIAEEAARIGHDVNNSLGVIGGRAELIVLHLGRGNEDGVRKGVETILAQVERLKAHSDALRALRHLE